LISGLGDVLDQGSLLHLAQLLPNLGQFSLPLVRPSQLTFASDHVIIHIDWKLLLVKLAHQVWNGNFYPRVDQTFD
jgi:hypothetical protein